MSDVLFVFFSSRRRHTRFDCDWSSDVCSSDLLATRAERAGNACSGCGLRRFTSEPRGTALSRCYSTMIVDRVGMHAKRSEEHTSELQSQSNLVCRLLLEKKKRQALDSTRTLLY